MTKHTPSLEEVRDATSLFRSRFFDQDEFDRWYQAEVAAAEQRGKAEGWDEGCAAGLSAGLTIGEISMGTKKRPIPGPPENPYRADRMEGDDD